MAKKKVTSSKQKEEKVKNKYDETFKLDMDFDEAMKKIVDSKKSKKKEKNMAYKDLLKEKNDCSELIGTNITYEEVPYKIDDIVIFPRKKVKFYHELSKINPNPENSFMTDPDIELMLICTNLTTEILAYIPFAEVF